MFHESSKPDRNAYCFLHPHLGNMAHPCHTVSPPRRHPPSRSQTLLQLQLDSPPPDRRVPLGHPSSRHHNAPTKPPLHYGIRQHFRMAPQRPHKIRPIPDRFLLPRRLLEHQHSHDKGARVGKGGPLGQAKSFASRSRVNFD